MANSFTWPDGFDVAQATLFVKPASADAHHATNIMIQLRTDAAGATPADLADRDFVMLRDTGARTVDLDRNVAPDGATARFEFVFDAPTGMRLRQISSYLERDAGVYMVSGTIDAAEKPDALRAALASVVDALTRRKG